MSLVDRLSEDMKTALKSRDELRLSTIRLVRSEIKYEEINKGHQLGDDEVIEVLVRESKKRREAAEGAEKAGRSDLAEKEKAELAVLQDYLPKQLGEDEIEQIVKDTMSESRRSRTKGQRTGDEHRHAQGQRARRRKACKPGCGSVAAGLSLI